MEFLSAPELWLSRFLLQRALGAIYLIAFLGTALQWRPLLGERGLTPVPQFVRLVPFGRAPSIFHLHYSDRFATAVAWTGVVLAAAVVAGLPGGWPTWATMLVWAALWAAYLSFVNVGQVFYAFGWETLLTEAGFLAIFLGPRHVAPPLLVLWLVRWLLFRVEFGAGLIKLRGDPCWRDLTCLYHHHETQPLPNPLSWRFHHLPRRLHRVEVAANHVTQVLVPFALFTPQPVAGVAAGVIVVTQLWLMLSGNFSWLNALTLVLAFSAFSGPMLSWLPAAPPADLAEPALWHHAVVLGLTLTVAVLSYWPITNLLSRRQAMNASFDPLRLVNTYGAFGSVTRERYEVILEGLDADGRWHEYECKAKPGDPDRRPPQVAPYHLRLDWLLWFAALQPGRRPAWFLRLTEKLLAGDPDTLRLLRHNPFPDRPPRAVRARFYRYRFTTPEQRRRTGAWWDRELVGEYLPPMSLDREAGLVPA